MLELIVRNMAPFGVIEPVAGHFQGQASVLMLVTRESEPEVILTKRAEHLNRHRGEVAFPGGMWEADDTTLLHTALRETEEEVGVGASEIEMLGMLPMHVSKGGVKVTPFVGLVDSTVELTPCPDELDSIFRVPLTFFMRDERIRTDFIEYQGKTFWTPAYRFEDYEIWGFTARVIKTFLAKVLEVELAQESSAPERYLYNQAGTTAGIKK